MAMVVNNNMAAQLALNEMKKNSDQLDKNLKKVSSGMKIVGAGDGASEYSISEKMRVRIRGLDQCNDNTKTGHSLISLASQAVDEQVQVMQKLREIALKASDDTYSQPDRDILQGEANHLLDQLDAIGNETQYNGKSLLNGVQGLAPQLVFDTSGAVHDNNPSLVSTSSTVQSGGYPPLTCYDLDTYERINGQTIYDPNSITYQQMTFTYPTGLITTNSQVYDSNGVSYTVTTGGSNQMGVVVNNVFVPIVDSAGNDSNGTGVVAGPTFTPYERVCQQYSGTPAVGATISLSSTGSPTGTYGTEPASDLPTISTTSSGKNSYELTMPANLATPIAQTLNSQGVSMLCTACGQFVSIIFDGSASAGSLNVLQTQNGGSGSGTIALRIGINGAASGDDVLADIWTALTSNNAATTNTVQGVTYDSVDLPSNGHPLSMERYLDSTTNKYRYLIVRGQNSADDSSHLCLYDGVAGEIRDMAGKKPQQTIYIQGDTKGSLETAIYLPNTTLEALFPPGDTIFSLEPQPEDYPDEYPSSDYDGLTEAQKKQKWRDECWPYAKAGAQADGSCLRTRQNAEKFLDDIDQAMKYLLAANTTLGAQVQRMEVMGANLVTTSENTQASESTIRDADMAREMTNYVKSNVLTQSASAMLAQANQQPSSVLSLLQ